MASPSSSYPLVTQSQSQALPLRRAHVQAPTLLTTSLNNAHNLNHGLGLSNVVQTPLSTTGLSSPFTLSQSPHSSSPSMAAVRGPVQAFSGTYNPQQWGRISDGMGDSMAMSPVITRQHVQYAPRPTGPDEPMVSPPPPYTADPLSAESASPAGVFSHGVTPMSTTSAFTPESINPSRDAWPSDSGYNHSGSPLVNQSAQFPPPPPANQRVRSTSRNHTERFLDAINMRPRLTIPTQSAIEPQQHRVVQQFEQIDTLPPAARRAVSASAVSGYSTRPIYDSPIQQDIILPIPPPPPGPPPANSRSQSMNRVSEVTYSPQNITPRSRIPPSRGAALGPVPPTPANWVDQDDQSNDQAWPGQNSALVIDTISTQQYPSEASHARAQSASHIRSDSIGLVRSPAVRNRSAKGLRERRSESKVGNRQNSGESEPSSTTTETFSRPLQDIKIGEGTTIAGRRASMRLTPKSTQFRGLDEALQSADSLPMSGRIASERTTPQSATFSNTERFANNLSQQSKPENLHRRVISGQMSSTPTSASIGHQGSSHDRPVSHILHLPNDEEVDMPILPLSPDNMTPRNATRDSAGTFTRKAMDRHRLFLQQEAEAQSDSEKLHLFIQHMVAESKIRRERYSNVFEQENLSPSDLMEGFFEKSENEAINKLISPSDVVRSNNDSRPSSSSTTSFIDSQANSANHQTPSAGTSIDHPILVIDTAIQDNRRGNFVPCLSPIASMSAVTREETESRGRAPSRWWESGSNPSMNGDGFKVLERSKRESKYMSAVIENEISPAVNTSTSNQYPAYGENEYPPEKYVPHEKAHHESAEHDAPYTPNSRKLDVSRLITLPPPYPRRHPAVNNSHPDLASIRGTVRVLNDGTEIDAANQAYAAQIREKRTRADSFQEKQQKAYSNAMQRRMESGTISQREYDTAEANLESTMMTSKLDLAKADFTLFESLVVTPVHTIYTTRITRASEALNALSARLLSDTGTHSPNLPQEAGDELPELLEKLTMLKWLFEARESLHRDLFTLLSARNDRYKATVLIPLVSAEDAEEKSAAESFFASDSLDRKKQFFLAVYQRWTSFHSTIESHVTQGVEIIVSAFWDIAPPLQALLTRVPTDLRDLRPGRFDILIPRSEVEENPIYWDHPLRYLWSIVCHAESSTRQFVEGQVSLWCLLQEVREGVVRARKASDVSSNAAERGREVEEGHDDEEAEFEEQMNHEIRSGLDDLKEKVASVEGQWIEGLGGEMGRVKEGLKAYLEYTGGWDDELDENEDI